LCAWVEQCLAPALEARSRRRAGQGDGARPAITAAGALILYLPLVRTERQLLNRCDYAFT
jgi:hypothetical protein